jgi:hypothetical protein
MLKEGNDMTMRFDTKKWEESKNGLPTQCCGDPDLLSLSVPNKLLERASAPSRVGMDFHKIARFRSSEENPGKKFSGFASQVLSLFGGQGFVEFGDLQVVEVVFMHGVKKKVKSPDCFGTHRLGGFEFSGFFLQPYFFQASCHCQDRIAIMPDKLLANTVNIIFEFFNVPPAFLVFP